MQHNELTSSKFAHVIYPTVLCVYHGVTVRHTESFAMLDEHATRRTDVCQHFCFGLP